MKKVRVTWSDGAEEDVLCHEVKSVRVGIGTLVESADVEPEETDIAAVIAGFVAWLRRPPRQIVLASNGYAGELLEDHGEPIEARIAEFLRERKG